MSIIIVCHCLYCDVMICSFSSSWSSQKFVLLSNCLLLQDYHIVMVLYIVTLQARFEDSNPTGAIVGVLLAIILVGTVVVVTLLICLW